MEWQRRKNMEKSTTKKSVKKGSLPERKKQMSKSADQAINEQEFRNKEPINEYRFLDSNKEHLHTLAGKPLLGTSTVVGVLSKPLTWWAAGLACEKFGWVNKGNAKKGWTPKEKRIKSAAEFLSTLPLHTPETWLTLCDDAYAAHSKKLTSSAVAGTDLHAELERFVKDHMGKRIGTYDPKIQPFVDWTMKNVKRFLWSEMHCYSEKLWVGGITDCGVELNDGTQGIIDFKSSKESYDSQFIQIAGYDIQISENGGLDKGGAKIFSLTKPLDFYAVVPFGADTFTVDFKYNVEELKKAFECVVFLYKLLNK